MIYNIYNMSLHLFKDSNIIQCINSYLSPLYITDDILLDCKNDNIYNDKLFYLINYNISISYAMKYAEYPIETMDFLIILSRMIGINDAYDILMNIPLREHKLYDIDKKTIKDYNYNVIKLLKYNYSWSIILIDNYINADIIKKTLNKLIDFYFFELLSINKTINNQLIAFELVLNSIDNKKEQKNIYYKLAAVKIPHNIAYNLCKLNYINIDKIIEIAQIGFNNVSNLIEANNFDENQIDFLRLSKLNNIYLIMQLKDY